MDSNPHTEICDPNTRLDDHMSILWLSVWLLETKYCLASKLSCLPDNESTVSFQIFMGIWEINLDSKKEQRIIRNLSNNWSTNWLFLEFWKNWQARLRDKNTIWQTLKSFHSTSWDLSLKPCVNTGKQMQWPKGWNLYMLLYSHSP